MTVSAPAGLLILAVAAVGVLHTLVPDHWAPIAVLARQQGWSPLRTARAAAIAGVGHTVSTLAIAVVVWLGGLALAFHYGNLMGTLSSLALLGFGTWIARSRASPPVTAMARNIVIGTSITSTIGTT